MGNLTRGIKVISVMNILIGLLYIIAWVFPFLAAVIFCWVTDMKIENYWHWFSLYILDRFAIAVIFVPSFLLLKSGFLLLHSDMRARKLSIISSSYIVFGELLSILSAIIKKQASGLIELDFFNVGSVSLFVVLFYLILSIVYLTDPRVKDKFDDVNVKLDLRKLILIIIIVFIAPLILFFKDVVFSLNIIK